MAQSWVGQDRNSNYARILNRAETLDSPLPVTLGRFSVVIGQQNVPSYLRENYKTQVRLDNEKLSRIESIADNFHLITDEAYLLRRAKEPSGVDAALMIPHAIMRTLGALEGDLIPGTGAIRHSRDNRPYLPVPIGSASPGLHIMPRQPMAVTNIELVVDTAYVTLTS